MKKYSLILIIISVYNCLENRDYLLKRKLETSSDNILGNQPSNKPSESADLTSISTDSFSHITDISSMSSDKSNAPILNVDSSSLDRDISNQPIDMSSILSDSTSQLTNSISTYSSSHSIVHQMQ